MFVSLFVVRTVHKYRTSTWNTHRAKAVFFKLRFCHVFASSPRMFKLSMNVSSSRAPQQPILPPRRTTPTTLSVAGNK